MKKALSEIRTSQNSHYVRKSRNYTAHGIPDKIFFLAESVGTTDYKKPYEQSDLQEIELQVNIPAEYEIDNVYQEYFAYSSAMLRLQEAQNWRESLAMYERMIELAE